MASLNPITAWKRVLALPNDSRTKAVVISFAVSALAALAVSSAAVLLQPRLDANLAAERQARLDRLIAELPGLADLIETTGTSGLEAVVVDLTTGTRAEGIDAESFDTMAAANDPDASTELSPEADLAGIGRRPDLAKIFLARDGGAVKLAIVPIWGTGYQSTIRAYLALGPDLNTVAGLSIVEQSETPGLGARIAEPDWQARWPGRTIADDEGNIVFEVVRGQATGEHQVDGITGATRTNNAITDMIRFWAGPDGYGPVLDRLRSGDM